MMRHNIRLVDIGNTLKVSPVFIGFWINNERESQKVKEYFLNVLKVPLYLIEVKNENLNTLKCRNYVHKRRAK
jgi:GMP synthase PP-ATPase subunit